MDDIQFMCPSCKQSLAAPPELAGRLLDCPSCNQVVEVPQAERPTPQRQSHAPSPEPSSAPRPPPSPVPTAQAGPRATSYGEPRASRIRTIVLPIVGVLAIAALIAAFLVSHKREVKGSVFIVTQAGQNIKLGLVPVRIFKKADVQSIAGPILQSHGASYSNAVKQMKVSLTQAAAVEQRVEDMKLLSQAKLAEIAKWAADRQKYLGDVREFSEELRRYEQEAQQRSLSEKKLNEEFEVARQRAVAALKAVQSARTRCLAELYAMLPNNAMPVADAQSDADGRFVLITSQDRDLVLVASTSRNAGTEVEEYYWLLKMDALQKDRELLLSNDLLLTASSSASLFNIDEYFPIQAMRDVEH